MILSGFSSADTLHTEMQLFQDRRPELRHTARAEGQDKIPWLSFAGDLTGSYFEGWYVGDALPGRFPDPGR